MTGKAYFVVGPESSGTRLVTEVLIAGGATGQDTHDQDFDKGIPEGLDWLVWRRSMPHAGVWPDLLGMAWMLNHKGYAPVVVVCCRSWLPCTLSQVKAGHRPNQEQALSGIEQANRRIFNFLGSVVVPFVVVDFGTLISQPVKMQQWLWEVLGLPGGKPVDIGDTDSKHWGER